MSQENVEIVRQLLEAFAGGDVEEMLSYILSPAQALEAAGCGSRVVTAR